MKIEEIQIGKRYYIKPSDGIEVYERLCIAKFGDEVVFKGSYSNIACPSQYVVCEVPKHWFQFWK